MAQLQLYIEMDRKTIDDAAKHIDAIENEKKRLQREKEEVNKENQELRKEIENLRLQVQQTKEISSSNQENQLLQVEVNSSLSEALQKAISEKNVC